MMRPTRYFKYPSYTLVVDGHRTYICWWHALERVGHCAELRVGRMVQAILPADGRVVEALPSTSGQLAVPHWTSSYSRRVKLSIACSTLSPFNTQTKICRSEARL